MVPHTEVSDRRVTFRTYNGLDLQLLFDKSGQNELEDTVDSHAVYKHTDAKRGHCHSHDIWTSWDTRWKLALPTDLACVGFIHSTNTPHWHNGREVSLMYVS